MDQWSILVLGTLRLGLNSDYDRILELANQHRTLSEMLGLGCFDANKRYYLIPMLFHCFFENWLFRSDTIL